MSHSSESEDAFSDGGDRAPIRITRARLSSPSASSDAVAAHVPRVIRTAAAAASRYTPASTRGYSPKVSVDMAVAHSWAPYAAFVGALRSLSLLAVKGNFLKEAKEAIAGLYGHPTPFGAAQRFPAGEVYVCLDRPPLAWKMQGIQESLVKAEGTRYYAEKFASACSSYMNGIGNALDELTRVRRDDERPVLYDREVFESAFLLTWTEP